MFLIFNVSNVPTSYLYIVAFKNMTTQLLLAMGNFLNRGNTRIGAASGFKINFLRNVGTFYTRKVNVFKFEFNEKNKCKFCKEKVEINF